MAEKSTVKEIELDGYKFTVDTDMLDDVDAFEIIDRIENKGQVVAVVPLLTFLIGSKGYNDMKAHFAAEDKKEYIAAHPEATDYKGKFRVSKLSEVYQKIIENFDPKG